MIPLTISEQHSAEFADLSCDTNPMHLDPVFARRLQFGTTVIHGVHGTLLALDALLKQLTSDDWLIRYLKVDYVAPVHQGQTFELTTKQKGQSDFQIVLRCKGKAVQKIRAILEPAAREPVSLATNRLPSQSTAVLALSEAQSYSSQFYAPWNRELAQALFPNLTQAIPAQQISFLLGLTYVVGMQCPGQDSIFAGFVFEQGESSEGLDEQLAMRVCTSKTDDRFNSIVMDATASDMTAEITAIFRARPVAQASFTELANRIESDRFSHRHCLVIGGSRGLGEVAVKALVAGGASVDFTYAHGHIEANAIVQEIAQHGRTARTFRYNVLAPDAAGPVCPEPANYTDVLYFSSPKISPNSGALDTDLLATFMDFYVFGLDKVLRQIQPNSPCLNVVMPSTSFIDSDERGFGEYITAKYAAERYLHEVEKKHKNVVTFCRRLPAMLTDQNAGLAGLSSEATLNTMLNFLLQAMDNREAG